MPIVGDTGVKIPFRDEETQLLNLNNKKQAEEFLQRRETALRDMQKMQKSLNIQNEQEARAASVKAAGGITEDQEDTWNNTVIDLTNKWEKGQITEDDLKFKIIQLPGMVAAQKPKLPQPKLPQNLKDAAPISEGRKKDLQQPPTPKTFDANNPFGGGPDGKRVTRLNGKE